MTALASIDEIVNRLTGGNSGNPDHRFFWKRGGLINNVVSAASGSVGVLKSTWQWDGFPGAPTTAPGAPAVPDNTTAGGLKQADPSGGRQKWLLGFEAGGAGANGCTVVLYDRLSHLSGLSATSTNPQAANGNTNTGTVTITLATPGVVSLTAHGFGVGQRVRFTTTGALPTGLTAGTDYYVSTTSYGANSFVVSDTRAHALAGTNNVATSVSQSGTHTVTGQQDGVPTRYTDGLGNFAMVEIYTTVGATARTITAKYTDQDGNAGNTSGAVQIGGATNQTIKVFDCGQFPLASGDVGVLSVDQVTLSASTGTAGDFGVTIGHELARVHLSHVGYGAGKDCISGWPDMVEIKTGACLSVLLIPNGSSGTANYPASFMGAIHTVER